MLQRGERHSSSEVNLLGNLSFLGHLSRWLLLEKMVDVSEGDRCIRNSVTIWEASSDHGAGGDDGLSDLVDLLVWGKDHRSPDAPVDQGFIPGRQLEGANGADLEGDDLAEIKILDRSSEVVRQARGIGHIVFQVV